MCIDYIRGTDPGVKEKLISCKQGELNISSITLSELYSIKRSDLSRKGLNIGALDMLIAAHAASKNMILVTHNTSEFARIQGLKLRDWFTNSQ